MRKLRPTYAVTNQALVAGVGCDSLFIYACRRGKEGLREMAEQNVSKAQFALAELTKIPGVKRVFSGPLFNEFAGSIPAVRQS